jgi:hypothetical protein
MYIVTDASPYQRSWKEPWSCIIGELDRDARAFLRVRQTQYEVWQSTTRCNISMERKESNTLKISWYCCFQRIKERLIVKEDPTKLSETWDGGHDIEPSTKWKTPWPRRYDFIYIRQ